MSYSSRSSVVRSLASTTGGTEFDPYSLSLSFFILLIVLGCFTRTSKGVFKSLLCRSLYHSLISHIQLAHGQCCIHPCSLYCYKFSMYHSFIFPVLLTKPRYTSNLWYLSRPACAIVYINFRVAATRDY